MINRTEQFKQSIKPHLSDSAFRIILATLEKENLIVIHNTEFKTDFQQEYDAVMAAG